MQLAVWKRKDAKLTAQNTITRNVQEKRQAGGTTAALLLAHALDLSLSIRYELSPFAHSGANRA